MQDIDNKLILLTTTSTLLFLTFVVLIFSLVYKFKKKQLQQKKDIEILSLNHQKNLLTAQIEIQEQTLKRIAREIHDNISLSLTLAKLHLNTYEMGGDRGNIELVRTGIDLIGRTLIDLNNLSKSLDAQTIEKFGLVHALETESELIRKSGRLDVSLSINGEPVKLESERELHVYRIIQECFNNTLKHAEAGGMTVRLDYGGDTLRVTVADDGRGFDPAEALVGKPGSGLRNMENRSTILGGDLRFESRSGGGSKMIVNIPYKIADATESTDQSGTGR
jgi:two-component system NarL family sensor kinase